MTIPMLVLTALALAAVAAGCWAAYREWDTRCKERELGEVWARRALRLKQQAALGITEQRARTVSFRVKPLTEDDRVHFRAAWRRARLRFAEDPLRGISEVDQLVSALSHRRGVPAWTLEYDQATPLAWRYPELEEHYRTARRIVGLADRRAASREDLERALESYKVVCERLLDAA